MDGLIPIDDASNQYTEIRKVKQQEFQYKYPFSDMDEGDVVKTLKQIELVYQNVTSTRSVIVKKGRVKKGGGNNTIVIFTL